MINRSGKECSKVNCKNYKYYKDWFNSSMSITGQAALKECRNCRYAHVSQYQRIKQQVI